MNYKTSRIFRGFEQLSNSIGLWIILCKVEQKSGTHRTERVKAVVPIQGWHLQFLGVARANTFFNIIHFHTIIKPKANCYGFATGCHIAHISLCRVPLSRALGIPVSSCHVALIV